MKISNQAFLLALVALGFGACSEDNPWGLDRGQGGIDLKLSASANVKDAIPVVRSGAPELVAPDVADFAISLRSMETDQLQTWPTLADFNAENGFDVGAYTLTAYYGNEHDCGFDKPYFKGEATVNVLEGRESRAEVTATLANSMLSIDYTDAFKNYFSDYSVTAHTAGESMVTFARTETRAAFMTPGNVVLELAMVNPNGQSARLRAASFPAAATHHYHVTFDVNADPVGNATLEVIFDDSLTQENVTISLSDELFTSEAPKLVGEGFTDGVTVEALSGNISQTPLKFNAICKGGIKSATLTVAGEKNTPVFGREVELVGADATLQNQLEANGVKVTGIFKNPSEMAVIDVTGLSKYLPSDNYQVSVRVTDMLDRVSEPVTLALSTKPILLSVIDGSAIYSYPGSDVTPTPTVDATVMVSYNGINPQTNISFRNKCRTGVFKDCEIVSVQESTRTRAFEEKTYIFNIKVCDAETSPLPMRMFFNGVLKEEFEIEVIEPKFTLEADPFATYCKFRINAEDPSQVATIANGLTIYCDGTAVDKARRLTVDAEKGLLTLNGLSANSGYVIEYSLTSKTSGIPAENRINIHTESEVRLDNGDFADTHTTINKEIQVGGKYRCGAIDYTNWVRVFVNEPDGWASVNGKTFYEQAGCVNSWFTVVSTYAENGSIVLRSVAYDHNGSEPARTGSFTSGTHYCTNVPASFASKSAGELFLGSYSFNESGEVRSEGLDFASRPNSLSFTYSYVPVGSDYGSVVIEILDVSGAIIGTGSMELGQSSDLKVVSVPISGYVFGKKAAKIKIGFKSSVGDFQTVTPDPSVDSWSGALPITPYRHKFGDNQFHTFASGSVLTIRNVKLNY